MVQPPFPFSTHLWPPPTLSTSTLPLPPPLHSNSKVYLCNLYNYIVPTLRLTMDQHWTHLDLVPTPRAAICIPFLHLSYLPDPFSLTIMGNYSFLVLTPFSMLLTCYIYLDSSRMRRQLSSHFCPGKVPPCTYCSIHVISFLPRHPAGIYPLECPFHRYVRAL